jgi:pimeloyl-ACP methyl ester carboxylesterase
MLKSEDKRVEVSGGEVFVRRWRPVAETDGPAIVLLHDSLGCVELWRDFPQQLAERLACEVVAYDRLGFGQSTERRDSLSHSFIDDEADSVFPLLCSALGLEKVIPFGHSVGGAMAIAIAGSDAESGLCASVITESAQAFVEERTKTGIEAAKEHFSNPDNFARLGKYHGARARWVLDAWTETWLHPKFSSWSLKSHLTSVRCPVLAMHGDNDEFGSVAFPKLIAETVAGYSQAAIFTGLGHVPHREDSQVVLAKVSAFLQESGD